MYLSTVFHCFSFVWELSDMSANIDYPESRHFLTAYHHPQSKGHHLFSELLHCPSCPCSLTVYYQSEVRVVLLKHMAGQVTSLLKTFWRALISRVRAAVVTVVHTICDLAPSSLWLPLISPPPPTLLTYPAMSAFLLILYIYLCSWFSHDLLPYFLQVFP